jgi:signal transduction histidine kinase/CheY-like chemotaxis protein
MASYLSNRLQWLINGITKFRYGNRYFRFGTTRYDEFGRLAHSFDEMAESVVRSVHSPLTITDLDLRIIYANQQFLEVTGKKSAEEVAGQFYPDVSVYPYGTEYCPVTALQNNSGMAEVFYENRTEQFLQGNANYFYDENGKRLGYIVTSTDVTDLSLKQIQLEKTRAAAELASRHKSDFLARMSHELRTPMNAILGINAVTQAKIQNVLDKAEFAELSGSLRQLQTSSSHLLGILNDMLDISNLETGTVELVNRPLDLNGMLDEIVGMLRLNCNSKHLELTTQLDQFTPFHFVADGLRLRQALSNILNNAVKYTQENGKVELITERQERRDGKSLISFTVRDTGIGISQDAFERIFHPFEQADVRITRQYGGSGLGLAIAQQILGLFGSDIHVKSELGKGSEFSFAVWLQEDVETGKEDAYDVKGRFVGQKALVIDDVYVNRLVLVSLLKEAGFTTVEAKDGSEGLQKFAESAENEYDVVFMDIQMPVMDGYKATESIRHLPRQDAKVVPIVAISANAFNEDIDKSLASGMNSHYAKPINMEVLSAVLMKHCKPTE